ALSATGPGSGRIAFQTPAVTAFRTNLPTTSGHAVVAGPILRSHTRARITFTDMSDRSILLIEDARSGAGPAARALDQLRHRPYETVHAGTLAEGLDRLPERKFAAAILDLDLPDGKGMPAFLRFQSKADTVPIIVLVDRTQEELGVEATRRGAL